MSTRCHVVVRNGKNENKEKWNYIYHHCDGYPSGVGKELSDILTEIQGNGVSRKNFNANFITENILNYSDEYESDNSIHGDEEYIYLIDVETKHIVDGFESNSVTLTCYEVLSFEFETDPEDFSAEEGYKRYTTSVMYFDLDDEGEEEDGECEQEGHVEGYFNMYDLDSLDDDTFLKLFYRVTQEYADRFDEETFSLS
jgi:hypothetical protein